MPGTNGGMVDIYYEIAQRDDGVVNLHDSEVALNSRVSQAKVFVKSLKLENKGFIGLEDAIISELDTLAVMMFNWVLILWLFLAQQSIMAIMMGSCSRLHIHTVQRNMVMNSPEKFSMNSSWRA